MSKEHVEAGTVDTPTTQSPQSIGRGMIPLQTRVSLLKGVPTLIFDPSDRTHRAAFAYFMIKGKWPDGIRFIEEYPFTSAVTTIQHKLVVHALKKELMNLQYADSVIEEAKQRAKGDVA